jgi:hypothetical protein
MNAKPRWNLLLPFVGSIAVAVYAQYRFVQPNSSWLESLTLYAIAMLVFAWVGWNSLQPISGSDRSGNDGRTRVRHWLIAPSVRVSLIIIALVAGVLAAREANSSTPPESFAVIIALWLLSMGIFALAFVPNSYLQGWNRERMRAGIVAFKPVLPEIGLLVGITLLAFVLRAFDLEHIPMNLGGDEAEMGLQARAFLHAESKNPFVTGWLGHPTMFFFLQSLFMRVFGSTITGLRMLSAFLGTLGIPATYLLVRETHGRRLAFATATLLAAYAFHIHYSRLGLNNIADPLWATLVFFLIIRAVQRQRRGYYVAAGLALGFSMYFYIGARLVWVMLAVFLAFWMIQNFHTLWSQRGNFVLMGIAALLILLPLMPWFINHPETFWGRYSSMGIIPSGWLMQTAQNTGQSPLAIILERTRHALLLFNTYPETFGFYAPQQPLLDTLSAVLFVFGLAFSIYKLKERAYFLFVMWFVLAMFFGAVMVLDANGTARLTTTTVPVMFFVALGLVKVIEMGKQVLMLPPRWCLHLVVLGVAVIVLVNLKFYFVEYVPMRLNSGDGGWLFTDMSRLFLAETRPFKAYFFGAPYAYISHSTIRYMAPNLNGMDVLQPIHAPPDFVDHSRRAIFVFYPARIGEFEFVRQSYPNGNRIDDKKPNGQEIFLVYEVDNP